MNSSMQTIVMIVALAGAIAAVMIADAGLVTSLLIGAGVAGVIAVVGILVLGTPSRSSTTK